MKKGIIVLGLLVGTSILLTAQDNVERQRQNVVASEDCTLEGDQVGKGYLDEDRRNSQNSETSSRFNQFGKRQNHVDEETGRGYMTGKNENQGNRRGRNRNA